MDPRSEKPREGLLKAPPTLKTLVRCCLKGFGASHAQTFRKVLLKSAEKGPQWLNGQKSAEDPLKMLSADLFGVHIEMPKKGLGLRGGARSKPS